MPYYEFVWTDDLAQHIAEHGVSQDDFEYVICNPASEGYSRASGLPVAWGYTQDGRYVIAVYEQLDAMTILPVSAYEVPEPH
jgi:uncharacterized DUF497 family protein